MRTLTVREKILLHLFDSNRFAESYEAPVEVTQEGIARSVGIRVQHVNQYTKPLVDEGLVEERTAHVRGRTRRRKVYFLTGAGRTRTASLRSALLEDTVPYRTKAGRIEPTPLAKIYQEERRGTPLAHLVQELATTGHIAETPEVPLARPVDFTQEMAPLERFYGRTDEIGAVLRGIEDKPMVVVTGMPGIGKSSLAARVCDQLRGSRSLFWRQVRPWDTGMDFAFRLSAFLKSHGRTRLASLLAAGEVEERSRLEEPLRADLDGLRALLVFDDVHRATEDAQGFLALLLDVLKGRPGRCALLLSRTVPTFYSRREVAVEGSVLEVAVPGLDPPSSLAILADLGVREPLAATIADACGGIPLFLKLVAASGMRDASGAGWRTLETYIAEQIDPSLNPEERACMETAALYYVPVPPEAILVEGTAGRRSLLSLERKGLLASVDSDRYAAHDAIRGYFDSGLSADRRASLSSLVASWLATKGEEAARDGRLPEAVAYFGNAAAVEPVRARRAAALQRLGDLRRHIGDHLGALEGYREALGDLTDPATRARLHQKISLCFEKLGRLDDAEREVEAGLRHVPPQPSLEAAWLLEQRAGIAFERQDYGRALAEIERVTGWLSGLPQDPELWGWLANLRGLIYLYDESRYDPALAQADFAEAIESWQRIDYKRGLCMTYNNYFLAAVELGRGEEALPRLDECISIAASIGDLPAQETAMFTKAWYLTECRGDYEAAEALYKETYRLAKGTHERLKIVYHYEHFANLYRRQGRFDEAREALEYFLQASGDMLNPENRIRALGLMVRLCARSGHLHAAERYLEDCLRISANHGIEPAEAAIEWARAVLLGAKGDRDGAEAGFRRASAAKWPSTRSEERAEMLIEYGRFLAERGDRARAAEILRNATGSIPPGWMPLSDELTRALELVERPR